MEKVIIISSIMCICLVASVFFLPNIKIAGKEFGTYWIVALIGAVILIRLHCISIGTIGSGLTQDSAVNPIKILVLFLSMTVQSIFLDEVGMFRYLANVTLKKSGSSQRRLFFYLYAIVAVLTVFTSNDIIILTFTPFICYFSKNARINPIPFLFTEFVAANTWSMALIIGNPTNVYLASSNGITFLEYTKTMLIPTLVGGTVAMMLLYMIFRKQFEKPLEKNEDHFEIADKGLLVIGVAHLSLCTILLVISSYIGMEMWLITFGFALSLFIVSSLYLLIKRQKLSMLTTCFKRMPWELVPFVIAMFIFVLAMNSVGLTDAIGTRLSGNRCVFTYGAVSFVTANLVNNIPMSVLFSSIVGSLSDANLYKGVYAAVVGSNLGAFFTPVGALAGIMWTGILKKQNVEFKFATYVKYGAMISIPTLAATLLGLSAEFTI